MTIIAKMQKVLVGLFFLAQQILPCSNVSYALSQPIYQQGESLRAEVSAEDVSDTESIKPTRVSISATTEFWGSQRTLISEAESRSEGESISELVERILDRSGISEREFNQMKAEPVHQQLFEKYTDYQDFLNDPHYAANAEDLKSVISDAIRLGIDIDTDTFTNLLENLKHFIFVEPPAPSGNAMYLMNNTFFDSGSIVTSFEPWKIGDGETRNYLMLGILVHEMTHLKNYVTEALPLPNTWQIAARWEEAAMRADFNFLGDYWKENAREQYNRFKFQLDHISDNDYSGVFALFATEQPDPQTGHFYTYDEIMAPYLESEKHLIEVYGFDSNEILYVKSSFQDSEDYVLEFLVRGETYVLLAQPEGEYQYVIREYGEQVILLKPGWNIISTYLFDGMSVVEFREVSGIRSAIWDWDPERGQYVALNDDREFQPGKGYWVYSPYASPIQITMRGVIEDEYRYSFNQGWHLIGVPPQGLDASYLLESQIPGSAPIGFSPIWAFENGGYEARQSGDFLLPGKGYWVYATSDSELVIRFGDPQSAHTRGSQDIEIEWIQTTIDPTTGRISSRETIFLKDSTWFKKQERYYYSGDRLHFVRIEIFERINGGGRQIQYGYEYYSSSGYKYKYETDYFYTDAGQKLEQEARSYSHDGENWVLSYQDQYEHVFYESGVNIGKVKTTEITRYRDRALNSRTVRDFVYDSLGGKFLQEYRRYYGVNLYSETASYQVNYFISFDGDGRYLQTLGFMISYASGYRYSYVYGSGYCYDTWDACYGSSPR